MKNRWQLIGFIGLVVIGILISGGSNKQVFSKNLEDGVLINSTLPSTRLETQKISDEQYYVYIPYLRTYSEYPYIPRMVLIPEGEFQMGCDPSISNEVCQDKEMPLHTVYMDAYYVDKHEVTTAQYIECVADGYCREPSSRTSNTRSSYYGNPDYYNYPVVYVDWGKANDYCTWAGKHLPSEAQWFKAARGEVDTRMYPWGNEIPDCTYINFRGSNGWCVQDTVEVGSYPKSASIYGVMDTAGNVGEFTNDYAQSDYYSVSPYRNPPGPASGNSKIIHGGCWNGNWNVNRTNTRAFVQQTFSDPRAGFRCAYTP
jgi:formylglycine-generating enzyme required for sulfatase activity